MIKTFALVATGPLTLDGPDGAPVEYSEGDVINTILLEEGSDFQAEEGQRLEVIRSGWGIIGGKLAALPPAPPDVPAPAPVLTTYKSDIWRRATDDEAAIIDAALNAAPVKQRRLWADSTILVHGADGWDALRDQMVAAFGQARADEILAPSA